MTEHRRIQPDPPPSPSLASIDMWTLPKPHKMIFDLNQLNLKLIVIYWSIDNFCLLKILFALYIWTVISEGLYFRFFIMLIWRFPFKILEKFHLKAIAYLFSLATSITFLCAK